MNLISNIINKNLIEAEDILNTQIASIVESKLEEKKKMIAAELYEQRKLPSGKVIMSTGEKIPQSLVKQRRGLAEEDKEKEDKKPLFGKYQKPARKQPDDWVKDVYTGKMKEEKEPPFEPDAPRVKRPDEPKTAKGLARAQVRKLLKQKQEKEKGQ